MRWMLTAAVVLALIQWARQRVLAARVESGESVYRVMRGGEKSA